MPQSSIYYALGRIGVMQRTAMKPSQLERLMTAHTYEEATRTLADIGFAASEEKDYQEAADEHVLAACRLVHEVTPQPEVTDCFQYRYDVHNLKVLLKSRYLAQKAEYLSRCGTLNVEMLRHAVLDHSYHPLPPVLRETMDKLEKAMATKFDPMQIDVELDKAMYRMVLAQLDSSRAVVAKKYFVSKIDLQNAVILLRTRVMKKSRAFFADVLLPGGSIGKDALEKAFDEPERLPKLYAAYGTRVQQAIVASTENAGKLPLLEKETDDFLYRLMTPYRYQGKTVEPLIAYLLQRQREATDVRLVISGKINGFSEEAVAERVRELHG